MSMAVSLCLSVCLHVQSCISKTPRPNFTKLSVSIALFPVAVARSPSDNTAIRYVLPVLRMTCVLSHNGQTYIETCIQTYAESDSSGAALVFQYKPPKSLPGRNVPLKCLRADF